MSITFVLQKDQKKQVQGVDTTDGVEESLDDDASETEEDEELEEDEDVEGATKANQD